MIFCRHSMLPPVLWSIRKEASLNLKSIKKILCSDSGESTYISTVIYILVVVICISFVLDVCSIIFTKSKIDRVADQMTKQIQSAGGTNSDTQALFDFMLSDIGGQVENASYSLETTDLPSTPTGMQNAIQLGTPFYLTVTVETRLGGFWRLLPVKLHLVSRGCGVSEHYWK